MTPPGTGQDTSHRPSPATLERRIEKAQRQRDFARKAGWTDVAELYDRLASDLHRLAAPAPER